MTSTQGATRILAIAGSVRRGSYNRKLLHEAQKLAAGDAEIVLWDGLKAVPPFDEDDEDSPPAAVQSLREAIAGSDAVLIASPEYNASVPGQLKNALDWASRPRTASVLNGKPVAVIGASPTPFGALWAQRELRKVLGAIGAQVIDRELPVPRAHEQFDARGELADRDLRARLGELVQELVAVAVPQEALAA
jgi:chromate reductase